MSHFFIIFYDFSGIFRVKIFSKSDLYTWDLRGVDKMRCAHVVEPRELTQTHVAPT